MQYFAGTREFQIKEPTAVTIGKFDGLHRGHQKLLREVMRYREKEYKPAVFTFETAPGTLIRGKLQTMITTNEEREENLREAGVEYLVEYPFNQEVAHMDPEQFGCRDSGRQDGRKGDRVRSGLPFWLPAEGRC